MKTIYFLAVVVFLPSFLHAQTFTLKSNDLGGQTTNKQLFNGLSVHGQNLSPELSWEYAPAGTKSYAITMFDPTAPTGSGWWHWVIFNIPVNIHELKTGAGTPTRHLAPEGAVQSVSDLGVPGYMGPAPPEGSGFHQYIITVYALNIDKLTLPQSTGAAMIGFYLNKSAIGKASIIMYCNR